MKDQNDQGTSGSSPPGTMNAEIALLARIAAITTSPQAVEDPLYELCRELAEYLQIDQAGFALINAQRTAATVVAHYTAPPHAPVSRSEFRLSESPALLHILTDKTPLVIKDTGADPRLDSVRQKLDRMLVQSFLVVPVMVDGEAIGLIGMDSYEQRTFSPQQVTLAHSIANLAGQLLVRQQAQEELQQQARQLEMLRESGLALASALELGHICDLVVTLAMDLLDTPAGGLYLYRPEGDHLEWVTGKGTFHLQPGVVLGRGEGMSGRIWDSGQPLIVDNYQEWQGRAVHSDDLPPHAVLGVPVRWGHECLGVINVAAVVPRTFSAADAELLGLLAAQAGAAIERARRFESERRQRNLAQALEQAAQAVGSSLDLTDTLKRILEQVQRVVPCDTYSVVLLGDCAVDQAHLVAGLGYADVEMTSQTSSEMLTDSPILEQMARDLQPILCGDVRQLEGWRWVPGAEHVRSWICVPMVMRGQMIGALMLDHHEVDHFVPAELEAAQALAPHAAQAAENARLYQRAQAEIAERIATEAALRDSEALSRGLLEASPVGIMRIDAESVITYENPAMRRMMGVPEGAPSPVVGQAIANLEALRATGLLPLEEDLRQGKAVMRQAVRYRSLMGVELDLEAYAAPLLDEGGQWQGAILMAHDISEQRQRERQLQALNDAALSMERALTPEEVYVAAAEHLQKLGLTCLLIPLEDGRLVVQRRFVSVDSEAIRAAQEMFGTGEDSIDLPLEQAFGYQKIIETKAPVFVDDGEKVMRQILPEPLQPHAHHLVEMIGFQQGISAPLLVQDEIIGFLSVAGSNLTEQDIPVIQAFAHQIAAAWHRGLLYQQAQGEIEQRQRAEQELVEYSARLEDIVEERTEALRQAQEKLLRQEKLAVLGQLAGSVGHELRNPLSVITNAVYFLKMVNTDADETTAEYLDIINSEVKTAGRIVSDLLDFARLEVADRQHVPLMRLVQQALLRSQVPTTVEVVTDLPPNLPEVHVDPIHIEQILTNLIMNACQAMPKGGTLIIRGRQVEDGLELLVQDTGCGIPEEHLSKLFEPLFTTKKRGIGLGLAVSRNLAEANGGTLEAASEGIPGKGSTFTLRLPVEALA